MEYYTGGWCQTTLITPTSIPDDIPMDNVGRGKAWASSNVFLAYVDLLGTAYSSPSIATGFGAHLAQPLLRKELERVGGPDNLTEEDARRIIQDCIKVLYYRDARSLNKVCLSIYDY